MTTRNYSSRSQQSTLTGAVTSGATSMVVVSGSALLGGVTIPAGTTFTIVIDPDTAIEEIVDATAVSTNTFTITRAIDGSSAQAHSAGAVVRHMAIGRDYRESNAHIEASTGVHGISNSSSVVGTIDTQTLTNKTLTSPTITNPTISGTNVDASIVFEGATPDAFETTLTVVDPTQDNTITMPNTTGTVVIATATQTLTNKTLTSPVISGSPIITGLSSAGMVASSATPKDYVDSILGSATAAATSAASAATSATSAATSATSAAASATAAAASATASASSATAAATSATSAAASATAAATSATSSAASATTSQAWAIQLVTPVSGTDYSAKYNANLAAASATASASSATASATSATASASSASAAATSASSALTSQTAAATSATSAAASATAAATSATSAAASATAAATSATSAAASATAAAGYVVPSQTGNAGKFLGTDGTAVSWTRTVLGTFVSNSASGDADSARNISLQIDGTTYGRILVPTGSGGAMAFWTGSTPAERMRIDSAGNVGIGSGTASAQLLRLNGNATGGTTAYGTNNIQAIQSDVTLSYAGFRTNVSTQAAAFTLSSLTHFTANQSTIGASSAITNQAGFQATSSLTGATYNYGFYGDIASGTNRWNFYANGTAANYFAGQTTIGSTSLTLGTANTVAQQFGVVSTSATNIAAVIRGATSQTGDLLQIQNSTGTVLATVTSAGNVGIGTSSPSYPLHVSNATGQIGVSSTTGTNFTRLLMQNTGGSFQLGIDNSVGGNYGFGAYSRVLWNDGAYPTIFTTNSAERMRIDASGNVGIGTGSPSTYGLLALGFVNAASTITNAIGMYQSAGADNSTLRIAGYTYTAGAKTAIDFIQNSASNFQTQMAFSTYTGGALAEGMRITSAQNVGIGTTSPAAKLDVNGSIKSDNLSTNNRIINGAFDIWQRGISFAGGQYGADRFNSGAGSNAFTVTQVAGIGGSRYAAKITQTGSNSFTQFGTQIEFNNCYDLQNQTVTISFVAQANNTNSGSTTLIARTRTIAGVDGACLFTGTSSDTNFTITTTAIKYTVTKVLPATFGSLSLEFVTNAGVTGDGYTISNIKLELGSVATPFTRAGGTIQGELAACQRYFQRLNATEGRINFIGTFVDTTNVRAFWNFGTKMRTAPTLTFEGTFRYIPGGATATLTSLGELTPNMVGISSTGTTASAGYAIVLQSSDALDARINASAEL